MGESFASRVAGSLLSAIDLKELITQTEDEYEKLIYQYATNPTKLEKIKKKLEKNIVTKPLFNTKLFTKNIETAYKIIYKNYHSNLPIKNIEIK
jgi:predicted O-linked N-acetylglucosamine transferase (SPINDLY family)